MQQRAGSTGQRSLWLGLAVVAAVAAATVIVLFLSAGDNSGHDAARPSAALSSTVSGDAASEAKTFKREGYSFRYPASWVKGPNAKGPLGGLRTHFESSGGEEVLLFIAEEEPEALYEADYSGYLQFKRGWLDHNKHVLEEPAWGTVGDGIPALRYVYALENGERVAQRDTLIFDGRMFYEFSCRFRSVEMKRNCDLLEQSFRVA